MTNLKQAPQHSSFRDKKWMEGVSTELRDVRTDLTTAESSISTLSSTKLDPPVVATWTPTFATNGGSAISGETLYARAYFELDTVVFFILSAAFTLTGGTPTIVTATTPVSAVAFNANVGLPARGAAINPQLCWRVGSSSSFTIFKPGVAVWTTGSNQVQFEGWFAKA